MCLLDAVVVWDDLTIDCISSTHQNSANPLWRAGQLAAVHAFEYAAQAAAVHGGLRARAAGQAAPRCFLVALRDATLRVSRLDDIPQPLEVHARRLFGDRGNTVYHCIVRAGQKSLADARITIMVMPPDS